MKKTPKIINLFIFLLGLMLIFQACQSPVPNTSDSIKSKALLVNGNKLTELNKDPFSDVKANDNKNSFKIKSKVDTCLAKPVYAIGDPAYFGGFITGGLITRYDHYITDTQTTLGSAANMVWQFKYYGNNSGYIYGSSYSCECSFEAYISSDGTVTGSPGDGTGSFEINEHSVTAHVSSRRSIVSYNYWTYPISSSYYEMTSFSATYPTEHETISVDAFGANQFKVTPSITSEPWTLEITNDDILCKYDTKIATGSGEQIIDIGTGNLPPGTYTAKVHYDNCADSIATANIVIPGSCEPTPSPTATVTPSPSPTPVCYPGTIIVGVHNPDGTQACCPEGAICNIGGGGSPPPDPSATPTTINITPSPSGGTPSATPSNNPTPTATPIPTPTATNTPKPKPTPTPKEREMMWSTTGDIEISDLSFKTLANSKQQVKGGGTISNLDEQFFRFKGTFINPWSKDIPSGTLLVAMVSADEADTLIKFHLPLNTARRFAEWSFPFSGSKTDRFYDWYGKYGQLPTGNTVPTGKYYAVLMENPSSPLPPNYVLKDILITYVYVDPCQDPTSDNSIVGQPVGEDDRFSTGVIGKVLTEPKPDSIEEITPMDNGKRDELVQNYGGCKPRNWHKMKGLSFILKNPNNYPNGGNAQYPTELAEIHWYEYRINEDKGQVTGISYFLVKVPRPDLWKNKVP